MSNNSIRNCPICHRDYKDYPALSRRDNKTEICPECGVLEALEDMINPRPTPVDYLKGIKGELDADRPDDMKLDNIRRMTNDASKEGLFNE